MATRMRLIDFEIDDDSDLDAELAALEKINREFAKLEGAKPCETL